MGKIIYLAMFLVLLVPMIASSYALQEVAGKVNVQLSPGEAQTFRWGLLSDSNNTITVSLSAIGNGSQYLSFPKSVTLEPKQIMYVSVNASIPSNYMGKSILSPILFATQYGQQGGTTVINVAVEKLVTLNITDTKPITQGAVPEFPFAILALVIATFSIILIPKIR